MWTGVFGHICWWFHLFSVDTNKGQLLQFNCLYLFKKGTKKGHLSSDATILSVNLKIDNLKNDFYKTVKMNSLLVSSYYQAILYKAFSKSSLTTHYPRAFKKNFL